MSELVVMGSVGSLLAQVGTEARHAGLVLDKFTLPRKWDATEQRFKISQDEQRKFLQPICEYRNDHSLLTNLHDRQSALFSSSLVRSWTATTAGALTLHLSRANALENAGIALHPLYGFAYLPGSGLKGAARAYAETVWLQAMPASDRLVASGKIVQVFGCAPGSDAGKTWLPAERQVAQDSGAGAVVFHDAWPEAWPKLFVDIAAIHHPKYYQASENSVPPPGDWETPSLIRFLAIEPGTTFRFAVGRRSSGPHPDPALITLAEHWLNGALAALGIGAKTAAGYGLFQVKDFTPAALPSARAEGRFDLTLVTPAFLAGSAQGEQDCDLRGATLRGQLRWWWRTMHAAHLEPCMLRRLETAVWGASSEGSAVLVRLTRLIDMGVHQFSFPTDENSKFLPDNGIEPSNRALPESERRKTTQGLFYASYGATPSMARGVARPGRFFRQPGSTWQLRLIARASAYRGQPEGKAVRLPVEAIMQQASAALFLLTHYGGVGAKARKGFGSFADVDVAGIASVKNCERIAVEFRTRCGLASPSIYRDAPSLELMSEAVTVETKWTNAWFALNRIGEAMQAYAKTGKHKAWKAALGLPRKSDDPSAVRVGNEKMLRPTASIPVIGKIPLERHAAPAHFHIAQAGDRLAVRLVTFVSPHLPDEPTSQQRLDTFRTDVQSRLEAGKNAGGTQPLSPRPQIVAAPGNGNEVRINHDVQAELLEEKTPKGGWKARHVPSGEIRSIQNSHMVPSDKKPGDIVTLQVPSRTEFKWPVIKAPPTPPPRHGGPKGRR